MASMEGWSRAVQLEKRRRQEEDDLGMGPEDYFFPRDPGEGWRRMVLRALLLNHGGQTQTTFTELRYLSMNRSGAESSTTRTPTDGKKYPFEIINGVKVYPFEIILRDRLPDSKDMRRCRNNPDECDHSRMKSCGGQTFWFACRNCPARWPREQHEVLA